MMTHPLWIIVGFLGFIALRVPARMKFNRRNELGVEQFTSYGQMVRARWVQWGMRLGGLLVIILAIQHGFTSRGPNKAAQIEAAREAMR